MIRGQERDCIVNLNNLDTIEAVRERPTGITKILCYNGSEEDSECELGVYSTKGKAIKVLDMICEAYCDCNSFDYNKGFAFVKNGIFQMPKDSEVE